MKATSSIRWTIVVVLVPLALAFNSDATHVRSLAAKMLCNCGCGEVLAECSHPECKTKGALKQEIASALDQGNTDEQVLEAIGARHGASILLTPPFHGFDMFLWIVPMAGAVIAVGVFAWRRFPKRQ
jgi:cytochrome c-type biogenesis protein CcmH/NrfF